MFIVGGWDTTIDMAEQIRSDFRRYTCHNPAFSISGGIAILKTKHPIIAGAEESNEEEARAKGHVCGEAKKDSISFMGMPLNWQLEFPAARPNNERQYQGYDFPKSRRMDDASYLFGFVKLSII